MIRLNSNAFLLETGDSLPSDLSNVKPGTLFLAQDNAVYIVSVSDGTKTLNEISDTSEYTPA